MRVWSKEGAHVLQKSRGEYAPYRIQNRTGCTVYIWSDSPGTAETQDPSLVKLSSDEVIDWRFDDWRTTREVKFSIKRTVNLLTSCSMYHLSSSIVSACAFTKNHGQSYDIYL